MKPIHKIGFSVITSLTILFTSTTAVQAETLQTTISQQENEVDRIQGEMATLQSEITTLDRQVSQKQAEIDRTTNEINNIEGQIESTKQEILEIKASIKEKEEEITRLEASIERRIEILRERAVTLQAQNRTNIVLDVLLNSENIAELIQRTTSLQTLFQSDTDIMQQIKEDQEAIEAEKQAIIEQEQRLQERQASLEENQARLEEQRTNLQEQQTSLQASQSQKNASLRSLENNLSAVTNNLEINRAQLARQEAAIAFLAEQRERQENAGTNNNTANNSNSNNNSSNNNNNASNNNSNNNTADRSRTIAIGRRYIGVPYVWGGTTPRGFDCSGFVLHVFNQAGIRGLPRTSRAQWNASTTVSRSQARAGDLVFFRTGSGNAVTHVGIYMGGNQFIHSGSSTGVTITSLSNSFWAPRIVGFGRF